MSARAMTLDGIRAGVLQYIDLAVEAGCFLTVIGPSGAGKSTLLKVIAGLMPHAGTIVCGGPGFERLPAHRRNIGYVPQDLCLFPHRSVAGNLRLALKRSRFDKAEWPARISAQLAMLRIGHLAERAPDHISGGERQRVALARALVGEPSLMLLDEPFSSLDSETAARLRTELRAIHARLGLTTVMVTHNLDEAFDLGDRVLRMEEGRLSPAEDNRPHGAAAAPVPTSPSCAPHPAFETHETEGKTSAMFTLTDEELNALLAQDVPCGDLTTDVLGFGAVPARMTLAARDEMVLSASEEAARMVELCGGTVVSFCPSGTRLEAGVVFLEAKGEAGALHRAWKVAQTLVEYSAGIATRTHRLVSAARAANPSIQVACTRKNFPGTKQVSIKAIRAGGATIHRLGLSETLLVFANHRAFLTEPLEDWVARARAEVPEKKLVVETEDLKDGEALARAGVDVLQLDKMPADKVAEMVARVRNAGLSTVIIAAGGINETNAADYARSGCAVLVTSACYFGRPSDVKVVIRPRAV